MLTFTLPLTLTSTSPLVRCRTCHRSIAFTSGCSIVAPVKNSKRRPINAPNFIFMQDDAGDVDDAPSDTYVPAAEGQGPTEEQLTAKRASLIGRLLQLCAVTARGKYSTDGQSSIIEDLVMQLEEVNPTPQPVDTDLIDGYWTLVYINAPSTSSSSSSSPLANPNIRNAAMILLNPVLQFGQIRQRLSVADGLLTSEVDVIAFPATSAVVKTSARCTPVGGERLEVVVEKTSVTGGKLADALDLGGLSFDLPIEQIATRLRNTAPESYFDTFYLDDKLRISRDKDGKLYIYTRLE